MTERRDLAGFGAASLVGAIGGLGRPGIGFAPLFCASLAVLCFVASRSTLPRTATFAAGWSAGMFGIVTIGATSWGARVPLALMLVGCGLYTLPLSLWTHWASGRMSAVRLFVATAASWALVMEAGDTLGYPLKCATMSLVSVAPALLGGARLVGCNVIEGLLTAGVVVATRPVVQSACPRSLANRLAWAPPFLTSLAAVAALAIAGRLTAGPPAGMTRVGVPQIDAASAYYESRMVSPAMIDAFAARVHELLVPLRDVDLLVFPEAFDGRFDLQIPAIRRSWQSYAASHHQAILLTSYLVEDNGWKSNAVGGIAADGRWVGTHRKVDLAPYGERHLAHGAEDLPLPLLPGRSIGSLICQESVLARPSRVLADAGAALLTVSTSDSSFGSSLLVFEHVAMAQLRAIEVGRAIVWASNAGPSALIGRWGALGTPAPFREPAAARFEAPLFGDRTAFLRAAAAWPWLCAIATAMVLACGRNRAASLVCSPPSQRRGARRALSVASQALMLALAASLCVVSPALVEMARGQAARAAGAVSEVFASVSVRASADPFARFRTDEHRTAIGALAYYLAYYGQEGPLGQGEPAPTSLEQAREIMSSQLPSRLVLLRAEALPRVATVIEWADGTFGVMTRPTGEGDAQIFSPATGMSTRRSVSDLLRHARTDGLIPACVLCDAVSGCRDGA